jgi:protein involved in polysaccharide export with SLBB domain
MKMIIRLLKKLLVFWSILSLPTICIAQEETIKKDQYQIGPDENLLIRVHIFGEVKKPGEYLVPDDTDLLELISKAGGPTEFSNLTKIKITRGLAGKADIRQTSFREAESMTDDMISKNKIEKYVIKINLNKLLDDEKYLATIPVLQPGDVIRVGRNAWYTWQTVIRVVSELALIAQMWYWYSRSN